ncbi:hypothetical protein SPRG_10326 [Saprolegnia parasitica CBS 223.65]|uniref:Uncharacterized protein n=1 Tax=Saprolegnia parasitica (strain CBS 223.65) TaxID=695850 RepID=A0A067CD77_SAPPC|nr:hypothetical protein SPRG_10326 [Saprolegnia parasitica CBS 223.65]KDO24511.1 hypothetical protein SPRG_10326 [Saprolegnia parasitica CBS 223.65]|eukprot:XP_012204773.1 hypothetical protein SPRG_10326 [Saprolegnia parasitica CBS 223.65]
MATTKRADDPMAPTMYESPRFYVAFLGLGLGSWVMSDFVFAEVAALVQHTPEGPAIGVYVIAALQSANIFPMLYMLFNSSQQRVSIPTMIWWLLAFGVMACLLLATTWHMTSSVFGEPRSSALLFFVFCGGIVSATSSVVFYPFVSMYPAISTSALATGESLGAVVAGVLALLQDVGSPEMHFSISTYFACAAVVFLVSMVAFSYLRTYGRPETQLSNERAWLLDPTQTFTCQEDWHVVRVIGQPLACQFALACFSFAVVPSVLPILGSKYMHSGTVLKWASVLGMLCDPLARFLTTFYHTRRVSIFTLLALVAGLCMATQASARVPLWSRSPNGGIVVVLLHCSYMSLAGYTQTCLYQVLQEMDVENVKAAYQWSGFVTQMGALLGTIVTFGLVALTNVFSMA